MKKKEIKTKNHRQKNEVKIQNREHPSFLPFHHLSVLKMRRNKVTWHKLADPTSHQGFTSSYHTLESNKTASKKKLLGRLNNTSEKYLSYSCLTLVLVDVTWLVGVRVMHVGECKGEIGCAAHCHALQALRTHKGFMHCMY